VTRCPHANLTKSSTYSAADRNEAQSNALIRTNFHSALPETAPEKNRVLGFYCRRLFNESGDGLPLRAGHARQCRICACGGTHTQRAHSAEQLQQLSDLEQLLGPMRAQIAPRGSCGPRSDLNLAQLLPHHAHRARRLQGRDRPGLNLHQRIWSQAGRPKRTAPPPVKVALPWCSQSGQFARALVATLCSPECAAPLPGSTPRGFACAAADGWQAKPR
jgi:hypothetical protein